MSADSVKQALSRFLADPAPSVLCIEGRWGTGKTYAWQRAIEEASAVPDGVALNTYAYVSMFGLKEASDIIQSVYATAGAIPALKPTDRTGVFGRLDVSRLRRGARQPADWSWTTPPCRTSPGSEALPGRWWRPR